jgi:TRAP-type C4-dicarboxylate transport system permease small subunit
MLEARKAIQIVSFLLGKFSSWLIFFLTVITFIDILGRYLFNSPITGVFEITELALAVMVFLALGYTQVFKGHVTIDFFVSRLNPAKRKCMEIFMLSVSFLLISVLTWELGLHTVRLYRAGNVTGVLELPHWPIVLTMAIGSGVYAINILLDLLSAIRKGGSDAT